ncbi:MAG: response regulator [Coprothermobacterota bacterium]|nr:response regulator [Coprothermobacterota bacterium]
MRFSQTLAKGLKDNGFAVDIASLGEEALEKAGISDYDLAILDLNLPDIDGLELCQILRKQKPQLLILILTCRRSLKDKISGLDLGLMII